VVAEKGSRKRKQKKEAEKEQKKDTHFSLFVGRVKLNGCPFKALFLRRF
jgi:hypothetical protein